MEEKPSALDPKAAETAAFILDHTKDGPEQQLHDVEGLDGKAFQLLAAGSVIVGFLGVSGDQIRGSWLVDFLFYLALALFACAAMSVFRAVRITKFSGSHYASSLWTDYRNRPVAQIKQELAEDVEKVFNENYKLMTQKADMIEAAQTFIIIELICAVGAIALARAF